MTLQSFLYKVLPLKARKYLFQKYADKMLDDAIERAEKLHEKDGHRYFVLPTKSGDLKVTNIDIETRDKSRLNDKRLLKRGVRSPYQLRRESFYFTASDICKKRYNPDGMLDWELEAIRKKYYDWYFMKRFGK